MNNQNYLMVNLNTNVVDNIVIWNGNTADWQPPSNYLMLADEETKALTWVWDAAIKDCTLQEVYGAGDMGFTWDGTILTTNQPKPPPSPAIPVV